MNLSPASVEQRSDTQGGGRVAILLATYNGERYLDELMGSLLSQTYQDFVVLVRDDQSSDRTPEILDRWSAAQPDKVRVVSDDRGNLRSSRNFSRLMELCDAPYFAFCDQDDVWLPDKIERAVNKIRKLENQFGKSTPILVHSDLNVVDADLQEIAPSFFKFSHVNLGSAERLDHLVINNIVQGCTSVGNRALLELGQPIPDGVPFHDWWLALVAASCGVLKTIPEPTILWRQHGRNQVGAGHLRKNATLWEARHVLRQPRLLKVRMAKALMIVQSQASVLLSVLGDKMPRRNREYLHAFCLPQRWDEASHLSWTQRTWLVARFLKIYPRALFLALRWCY
jgi:glycosyltransferase involved in cell wall biosynthesis